LLAGALLSSRVREGETVQVIDTLRREHEVIRKALAVFESAADAVQSGGSVREELFLKTLEFITRFVHRLHQAKEDILFRRLAGKGLAGPEAREHEDVREFAAACAKALPGAARGDPASRRMLAENAKAYVGILRSHIALEDSDILNAALQSLSEEDDREIMAAFERVERELGEGAAGRYERLAGEIEDLAAAFGKR